MSCILFRPCLFIFPAKLPPSTLTDAFLSPTNATRAPHGAGHHEDSKMQLDSSQTLPSAMGCPRRLLTPLPASQTGKPDLEGCIQGRRGCAIPKSHVPFQGAKGPGPLLGLARESPDFQMPSTPFLHSGIGPNASVRAASRRLLLKFGLLRTGKSAALFPRLAVSLVEVGRRIYTCHYGLEALGRIARVYS